MHHTCITGSATYKEFLPGRCVQYPGWTDKKCTKYLAYYLDWLSPATTDLLITAVNETIHKCLITYKGATDCGNGVKCFEV